MKGTQNLAAYQQNVNGGSLSMVEMSIQKCWIISIKRPYQRCFPQDILSFLTRTPIPANKCMLNNIATGKTCEIYSKLTIKTPKLRQ